MSLQPASRKDAQQIDYVYILSASHSGSTLLALLTNSHPDVVSIGELASGGLNCIDGYLCSCGQPIVQCSFWRRVRHDMITRYPAFRMDSWGTSIGSVSGVIARRCLRSGLRGRVFEAIRDTVLHLCPSWRRHWPETQERCVAMVKVVLRIANARVLVDSSKVAHSLKFMARIPSLRVKVICLVRDGRAVALTYMDQDNFADASDPLMRRGGGGPGAPPTASPLPMYRAADDWLHCMRSAEYLLAGLPPDRWMRVRYEDLCRSPDAVMERVLSFIGVEPARRIQDFRSVEHHVVGNGMRLDSTSEIRLDERWRSVLTKDDLAIFDRVAGAMNRRYGYE